MQCEGMLERVLLCYIEVVNVTKIEMQDDFFIPTAGVRCVGVCWREC